jgi:UDP-hydrolysing UDP-N-acetyl-D-glucosamine 2-epimerase
MTIRGVSSAGGKRHDRLSRLRRVPDVRLGDAPLRLRALWRGLAGGLGSGQGVLGPMRVAVILTARPSWAKLEPVCRALQARPDVDLQIIACASALLERYGKVVDVVTAQGYEVAAECWSTYDGANLLTSAKETGALLIELSGTLRTLRADCAVVCADRHEVLAAAQAASYLHLPVVHLQGGERTGSIDDKVRDAITQLADWHCTATERALYRVYSLTGEADRVIWTGCPSVDLARQALTDPPVRYEELGGSGAYIDLSAPFLVIVQHPVTTEVEQAREQMRQTLQATWEYPRIVLFSGQDAGTEATMKALRDEQRMLANLHTIRNLPPARFLKLLTQAACLVGNSSAGIREASYLGVPVVNIGTRQHGRERAKNVLDVAHDPVAIAQAVAGQIAHGPYRSSDLYGKGDAGRRIADVITSRVGAAV